MDGDILQSEPPYCLMDYMIVENYVLLKSFSSPFYKIMVPTVDTLRYDFLVHNLLQFGRPVLLVGPVGTGKTSIAQGVLQKLDPLKYNFLTINLSSQVSYCTHMCTCTVHVMYVFLMHVHVHVVGLLAWLLTILVFTFYFLMLFFFQTSSNNVQDIIEGKVEKRTKGMCVLIVVSWVIWCTCAL